MLTTRKRSRHGYNLRHTRARALEEMGADREGRFPAQEVDRDHATQLAWLDRLPLPEELVGPARKLLERRLEEEEKKTGLV